MAVPFQTDPAWLRARLTDWLTTRDGGSSSAGSVWWELGEPSVPPGQGYSGELVLLPAFRSGPGGGRREARPLVVRLAPRRFRLYPWDRFAEQCRVMEILARQGEVPVPPVHGVEHDPAVLGAPFVVLGLVEGQVPPDIPPYHMRGFLYDMALAARGRVWDAALVAMARIHRLDPVRLGLGFAGQPEYGPPGMAQQLAAYERHLDFFAPAADARATVEAALGWLHEHPPAEPHPVRLLWGDARLANMIFQGERVAAILDWEMMSLGQPETDLAWFLHLDRHLSEGCGIPRLPGLPDRVATAARYAELLGRPLVDLDHHLLFASVRHTLLAARVTRMIREYDLLPPDRVPPIDRYAATLLSRVLDETRLRPAAPRAPLCDS